MITQEMPETHQQQIKAEVSASMLRAGIGRAYHNRALGKMGTKAAEELTTWVKGDSGDDLRSGRGITFNGSGTGAYDHFMLVARGLHLTGRSVRVTPLLYLIKVIEADNREKLQEYEEAAGLFIVNFHAPQRSDKSACPLNPWQVREIENYLLERTDNLRSVFLHTTEALSDGGWWSPTLVQRVATLNRHIEVPK